MSDAPYERLGDLVSAERPITYGIVQPGPDVGPDGIPLIRGKDYSNGNVSTEGLYHVLSEIDLPYSRSKVKDGDILFSIVGYVGNVAVVPQELEGANITQTTARLSIDDSKAWPRYVYHSLKAPFFLKEVKRYQKGSAQPGLNLSDVVKLRLRFIHDLDKQKKISIILDTIDQAIEKTKALIHKYQQIKAGLMHDLFTRGLTADRKLRPPREQAPELYQETPIGWISKEWKAKKLSDILIDSGGYLQTGPFGSQLHAHEYTHEGIPVVMPQDINDGKIATFDIARIPEKRAQILHKHRLKIGDIIIARRGELSRAAAITEVEKTWVCGTGCFLLRLGGSKLDARFFSYAYCHDIVQRQVEGLAVGTTMPSLNNTVMNALYFPYVAINEQNRIAKRLGLVERQIESLVEHGVKLNKQKSGLMHDLLTGKVPVTIDQKETAHGS